MNGYKHSSLRIDLVTLSCVLLIPVLLVGCWGEEPSESSVAPSNTPVLYNLQQTSTEEPEETQPSSAILPNEDRSGCVISEVPDELSFNPFYKKYCDAGGIPIISSVEVDDLALQQAYYILMNILAPIPEVHQELVANEAYFGIIGKDEMQTTLPEYAHMDSVYWDKRARGLGGSKDLPITSSAEENLLCLTRDRYFGESITVHEFAHTISLIGLGERFDSMLAEFNEIYEAALRKGLWEDTYAGSNIQEYWAEGVQSYFNTNLQSTLGDGVHNHVNTRAELAEYDPALYEFISDFFNNFDWTPTCP